MNAIEIEPLFTRSDGAYHFARWGRPIAPIVFGVTEGTLPVIKGALEAVVAMAGHHIAETDPELGSNCMFFFFRDWDELPDVPDLDKLVPDLVALVGRLKSADANQYRVFRFDDAGAIKACFVFLRMDDALGAMPAETLALGQIVRVMLLWSDAAFAEVSPLAIAGDQTILRPEIGAVIRAGYDPVMPAVSQDPVHAMRLAARVGLAQ
ncbi:hypothetical protein Q4577_16835 [Marinovum sp. 2_MG-2023]|uniref:hypothetical protein n=1 Tax=unclassified Marinovum TaxID=2647166 RepID=UPI0026E17703|nr:MULTISPECIES: hypothetical protein [unclassified Marinovum]MDO6731700.1 hypothetical protein [Marinovum sp. 2_MG-2023]MDO6780952.1 hypothetical protein [Marinovum sp. 1_MG-2023]